MQFSEQVECALSDGCFGKLAHALSASPSDPATVDGLGFSFFLSVFLPVAVFLFLAGMNVCFSHLTFVRRSTNK